MWYVLFLNLLVKRSSPLELQSISSFNNLKTKSNFNVFLHKNLTERK